MTAGTSSSVALVDTNILVYAYDLDDPSKHTVSRDLLENLSDDGRLLFSTQVLNEFCAVMMRPSRTPPFAPVELVDVIRELEAISQIVPVTDALTMRALEAMPRHGMSFWDALIWAAAVENAAAELFSMMSPSCLQNQVQVSRVWEREAAGQDKTIGRLAVGPPGWSAVGTVRTDPSKREAEVGSPTKRVGAYETRGGGDVRSGGAFLPQPRHRGCAEQAQAAQDDGRRLGDGPVAYEDVGSSPPVSQ